MKNITITGGPNNTEAMVTNQQELLVRVNSTTSKLKTANIDRPTTSGTTAAGINAISIANVGAANGTVDGVVLKPGETINIDAGNDNSLAPIDYDATGTEFLIISIS